jgi:hypothetical protein
MDEQAKKKFLMKVGIASFMVLIFVFWILNIKNVFRSNAAPSNDTNKAAWEEIKNDFNETVDKMSESLNKIEAANEKLKKASSSLINELIVETNKIASSSASTTMSTSSLPVTDTQASSSVKNNNCPAYIDCMPTIGEAKPCQIPVGCEGITQIAY